MALDNARKAVERAKADKKMTVQNKRKADASSSSSSSEKKVLPSENDTTSEKDTIPVKDDETSEEEAQTTAKPAEISTDLKEEEANQQWKERANLADIRASTILTEKEGILKAVQES